MQSSEPFAVEPERSRYRQNDNNCNQPARHFSNFFAEATCQSVPGRRYRILDMKPGMFE